MKRSEMLLKMQRYHGTQWCMVEGGYITLTEFYDNMLKMQQDLGMKAPHSDKIYQEEVKIYIYPDGNQWETE